MNNALPPNIPEELLPDQDFIEQIKRIEQKQPERIINKPENKDGIIMVETPQGPVPLKQETKSQESHSMPSQDTPKRLPESIELAYRFTGECPKHLIPVSTILFKMGDKHLCAAYCESCKTNITSRTVPYLDPKKGTSEEESYKKRRKKE